jgi:hypothetical protein
MNTFIPQLNQIQYKNRSRDLPFVAQCLNHCTTACLQALGADPIVGSQKGSGNDMPVKTIYIIYLLFPLSPKINTLLLLLLLLLISAQNGLIV